MRKKLVCYYLHYNSNYNTTFIIHIINGVVKKGKQI